MATFLRLPPTTARSSSGANKAVPGRRSMMLPSTPHPSITSLGLPMRPAASSLALPLTATFRFSSSRTTTGHTRFSRLAALVLTVFHGHLLLHQARLLVQVETRPALHDDLSPVAATAKSSFGSSAQRQEAGKIHRFCLATQTGSAMSHGRPQSSPSLTLPLPRRTRLFAFGHPQTCVCIALHQSQHCTDYF